MSSAQPKHLAMLTICLLAAWLVSCQTVESLFNFNDDGIAVQTADGVCKLINPEQQLHAIAVCDFESEVVLKQQQLEVRWRKADLRERLLRTLGVDRPGAAHLGTFSFYLKVFVFHPDQKFWFVVNQNREKPIGFLLNIDPGHWELRSEYVRTLPTPVLEGSLADAQVEKMLDPNADCTCYQTLAFEIQL